LQAEVVHINPIIASAEIIAFDQNERVWRMVVMETFLRK
jgi:hypothetical protein